MISTQAMRFILWTSDVSRTVQLTLSPKGFNILGDARLAWLWLAKTTGNEIPVPVGRSPSVCHCTLKWLRNSCVKYQDVPHGDVLGNLTS